MSRKTVKRKKLSRKYKRANGGNNMGRPISVLEIRTYTNDPNITHEVCGPIIGDIHYLDSNNHILPGKRANCTTSRTSDIWHTHPYTSKYYPSYEDIRTLLKHEHVNKSIIYTRYGDWILEYNDFYMMNNDQLDDMFKSNINNHLHAFYYATNKGHAYNAEAIQSLINGLQSVLPPGYSIQFKVY